MSRSDWRQQRGFTLMELLVVLVILGLIAGLVGPAIFQRQDQAMVKSADTQIKMLKGALQALRLDLGRLPTTEEGLELLRNAPNDATLRKYWKGPYLDEALPLDPWKRPFEYALKASETQPFSLFSYGADGQPGGEGTDADIGYLPKR